MAGILKSLGCRQSYITDLQRVADDVEKKIRPESEMPSDFLDKMDFNKVGFAEGKQIDELLEEISDKCRTYAVG